MKIFLLYEFQIIMSLISRRAGSLTKSLSGELMRHGVQNQKAFREYVSRQGYQLTPQNISVLTGNYLSDMRSHHRRSRQSRDPARDHLQNRIDLSTMKIVNHIIPTLKQFIANTQKIKKNEFSQDDIQDIEEYTMLSDIKSRIKSFCNLYSGATMISDELKRAKSVASDALKDYVKYIKEEKESIFEELQDDPGNSEIRDEFISISKKLESITEFHSRFSKIFLNLLDKAGKKELLDTLVEIQQEIDQLCGDIQHDLKQNLSHDGMSLQQIFRMARDERIARENLRQLEKLYHDGSLTQMMRYVDKFHHQASSKSIFPRFNPSKLRRPSPMGDMSSLAMLQVFQRGGEINDTFSREMERYSPVMTPLMKDIVFRNPLRATSISQRASQDRVWSVYIQFLFETYGKAYVESVIVINTPYPKYDKAVVSALELAVLTAIRRKERAYMTVIAFQLIDAGARPVFEVDQHFRDDQNFFLFLCIIAFEMKLINQDEISILISFESIATTICPSTIATIFYSEIIAPDD